MGTEDQIIEPMDTSVSVRLTGDSLEHNYRLQEEELQTLRESDARNKLQYEESQRRERILIRKLALKEQEIQVYVTQIAELKAAQLPGPTTLRSAHLDPAVNIIFQKLKTELQLTRARLEETQNELSAWKFTPDSNTGKRLMAKCRLLYQENEELGKMTSNGRLAKLEGDLALQKSFSEEVKKSQSELDDFLQELDEDVEGMQSTILFLQQELKTSKDTIMGLERENLTLKNGNNTDAIKDINCANNNNNTSSSSSSALSTINVQNGNVVSSSSIITNCSVLLYSGNSDKLIANSERILRKDKLMNNVGEQSRTLRSSTRNVSSEDLRTTMINKNKLIHCNGGGNTTATIDDNNVTMMITNGDNNEPIVDALTSPAKENLENSTTNCNSNEKRNYDDSDSSSDECDGGDVKIENNKKQLRTKKVRRSSVLSLDLNEEDSQIEIDDERTINGSGTKMPNC